ncbi:cell division protein FtsW [bacterium]|nr:cell division protein FtsW [bacterium]
MKKINPFFLIAFLFLLFGIFLIGDVSLVEAEKNFGDKFYFLKKQLVWAGIGTFLFLLASQINFHFWKKVAFPIFLFSLVFLILVLFPSWGEVVWGARRWISLGPFRFQPSEIGKLALLIYGSFLLTQKNLSPLAFWIAMTFPVVLVLLEPDFATSAMMVSIALVIWFLSGAKLKKVLGLSFVLLLAGVVLVYFSPYRRQRVLGMINPFSDPQGKSYHAYQLVLTLGSGGITGVGLGQSRQKYLYLPQVTTDSIMAVVGEEFGFLGMIGVTTAFLTMIFFGFRIALNCEDEFGRLFAGGLVSWLAIQGLINLSAIAVVLPLTGIPFPFVSYGGSSLIVLLFALGIMFNIYKNEKRKR